MSNFPVLSSSSRVKHDEPTNLGLPASWSKAAAMATRQPSVPSRFSPHDSSTVMDLVSPYAECDSDDSKKKRRRRFARTTSEQWCKLSSKPSCLIPVVHLALSSRIF